MEDLLQVFNLPPSSSHAMLSSRSTGELMWETERLSRTSCAACLLVATTCSSAILPATASNAATPCALLLRPSRHPDREGTPAPAYSCRTTQGCCCCCMCSLMGFCHLELLEMLIKTCGDFVHMHVAERDILHEMVKIVKKKP
ncbi:hypothetical protein ACQ4PT_053736 [Festuca glaucescens]